jgi:hypothetical protein
VVGGPGAAGGKRKNLNVHISVKSAEIMLIGITSYAPKVFNSAEGRI